MVWTRTGFTTTRRSLPSSRCEKRAGDIWPTRAPAWQGCIEYLHRTWCERCCACLSSFLIPPEPACHCRLSAFTCCLQHGKGTAEGAISDMKAEEENARLRVQREGELRAK